MCFKSEYGHGEELELCIREESTTRGDTSGFTGIQLEFQLIKLPQSVMIKFICPKHSPYHKPDIRSSQKAEEGKGEVEGLKSNVVKL